MSEFERTRDQENGSVALDSAAAESRNAPTERSGEAATPDLENAVRSRERLQALRDTGLLDSEVEEEFDRLTRLASRLLGVPATFFSLVDEDRDFYKSCFGFSEPLATEREITGVTFCHYSLVSEGALVIPDTRADPVYRHVPTVESMGVAAYLGVPVRAPGGEVLGSFCAIDFQPHDWAPLEIETMKELAKSAEREVSIRHWIRRQTQLIDRERAAREGLEQVMESRERLIRGFSHDLKNPMGAADGFLSLLEDGILGELSDKQKEGIARARRSIGAALALINELVELARVEAGRLEVRRVPLDVQNVVREMVEEYRAQARAKGLQLRAVESERLPTLESDPVRIRQILGNLLSNAVKYTAQGQVTVSVTERSGAGARDGEYVAIEVADTGPGIPEDRKHLLFKEFSRLEPESAHGAGLGLAISCGIAQALGGSISVESEVGRGSTFTLVLPVDAPTGEPDAE